MEALFIFLTIAAVSAGIGLWILAVLRQDVLPALGWAAALAMLLWPLSFMVGQRLLTCNAPDCGNLEFVALLIFATLVSATSLAGSTLSILLGWWMHRNRRR